MRGSMMELALLPGIPYFRVPPLGWGPGGKGHRPVHAGLPRPAPPTLPPDPPKDPPSRLGACGREGPSLNPGATPGGGYRT